MITEKTKNRIIADIEKGLGKGYYLHGRPMMVADNLGGFCLLGLLGKVNEAKRTDQEEYYDDFVVRVLSLTVAEVNQLERGYEGWGCRALDQNSDSFFYFGAKLREIYC